MDTEKPALQQSGHQIIVLTRQSITPPVTPAKQADAYYRKGGIMTGFYWDCGLFSILMNDTSKCFRNKYLKEIKHPAVSSPVTP